MSDDDDDLTLELGTDTILEIETTTTVVVETDLITELDPDGELTLILTELVNEIVIEPDIVLEIEVPGTQGIQGPPGADGQDGAQGPPGTQTFQMVVHRTTAQILGGHRLVTSDDAGLAVYADKSTYGDITRPLWLTMGAWGQDVVATLLALGMVEEPSWSWEPGRLVYLGHNGLLTQIAPDDVDAAFLVVVGRAVSATELWYDPNPPIAFTTTLHLQGHYSSAYGDYSQTGFSAYQDEYRSNYGPGVDGYGPGYDDY